MKNFFGKTQKRLYTEWGHFLDNGPFTSFGLMSAVTCGIVTSAYVGYRQGKKAYRLGLDRRAAIFNGCAVGGISGIVVGAFWPLVPVVTSWILIANAVDWLTKPSAKNKD